MTTKSLVIALVTVLGCVALSTNVYAQAGDVAQRIKQLQA
jgi:hypothetical protein